jgi:TetR/AcrR family transcriptional repressor of nem operon
VLARVAGSGEVSDEILAVGREAVLGSETTAKSGARKAAAGRGSTKTAASARS